MGVEREIFHIHETCLFSFTICHFYRAEKEGELLLASKRKVKCKPSQGGGNLTLGCEI